MEISQLKELSVKYNSYLKGDASLYADVNAMDKKVIASLKKEYLESVNRGRPVQIFRFVLLSQLEQGVAITQESFERIKNKLEKREVDDYDFLSPEAKTNFKSYPNKKKSFFVNWKNPATILFPFLYTEALAVQVKKSVEEILDTIIKSLKLTNVSKHIVDFNGPQNYGSGRCWGSIFSNNKPSHKDAHQLHFTLGANGFEGALYSGTNIPRDQSVDERETISTLEGLVNFLRDKKDRWLVLNNQEIETTVETQKSEQFRIPLNQIFFGPPGTGKTYHTINEAVKIVEELSDVDFENQYANNRTDLKKVYERYVAKGQIAFTTFHQSLSYEDFIEGIKPQTVKQSNGDTQITYEVKSGIFKSLCENAEGYQTTKQNLAQTDQNKFIKEDFSKAIFYKMSLGNTALNEDDAIYEYCIKNGVVALGWGGDVDFTSCKNDAEIKNLVEQNDLGSASGFLSYFKLYIQVGDYIIVSKGNYRFRAIGRITGDYKYEPSPEIGYYHFRKVDWILKDVDLPVSDIYNKAFMQQTLYKLVSDNIKLSFFDQFKTEKSAQIETIKRNYVLIIDEINRGNVSQIFGELITLLEEDKRKGNGEELSVTLPYSMKSFGVPSNLYIIGTMNTADRSVEALDSALRRRFFFKQMLPNADLLSPELAVFNLWEQYTKKNDAEYNKKEEVLYQFLELSINHDRDDKLWESYKNTYEGETAVEDIEEYFQVNELVPRGINLKYLLNSINLRIEKLLGRDHTIGHAYFIHVYQSENPFAALKQTFSKNIIPLLQEYFYGDYGKIGLVLGEPFVNLRESNGKSFAPFKGIDQNLRDDYEAKHIYELRDPDDWTKESFVSIYE